MVSQTRNPALGVLLAVLVATGASSGCYESLDIKKIRCSSQDGCPNGTMCCNGGCIKDNLTCPAGDGGDVRPGAFDSAGESREVLVSFDSGKKDGFGDVALEAPISEGDSSIVSFSDALSSGPDGGERPSDTPVADGDAARSTVDALAPSPDTRVIVTSDTNTAGADAPDAGAVDAPVVVTADAAGGSGGGGSTGTGGSGGQGGSGGETMSSPGGSTGGADSGGTTTTTGGTTDTGGTSSSGGATDTGGTSSAGGGGAGGGGTTGGAGAGGTGGVTASGGAIITGGTAPGNSWRAAASRLSYPINAATYGNGWFVAVGSGAWGVMTSTDGVNWEPRGVGSAGYNWTDVTYGQGQFVMIGNNSSGDCAILTLADIERGGWTSRTPGSYMHGSGARIAYGNGTFVVTGNWVCQVGANYYPCGVVSSDGITWGNRTMGLPVSSSAAAVALAFGNGTFHLIRSTSADKGMEFCSPDGNAWSDACARSSTSGEFYSFAEGGHNVLTYGNGMFVTTSYTGAGATSFDRLPDSESAWGHFKPYIDEVGGPIAAGNGGFFMIYPGNTNKGVLITGDTGWTNITLPMTATWTSIVYGANKFVTFSSVGDFAYSGVQ